MTLPTFGPTDEQARHDGDIFDALALHPFTPTQRRSLYNLMDGSLHHGPLRTMEWARVRLANTCQGRPLFRALEAHTPGYYPNQTPSGYQILNALGKESVTQTEKEK